MRWLLLILFVTLAFLFRASGALAQTATAEAPAETKSAKASADKSDADKGAAEKSGDSAKEEADEPVYLRVVQTDQGTPKSLQTAIVRYRGKKGSKYEGRIVDLVGVVHIGEEEYYSELNRLLGRYDVVLYELVAPDGTRIRPEDLENRRSVLASMQSGMKDMLNLEYQLEKIDYLSKNFRHADMSPEEFAQDLERRGDSLVKMLARMMGAGLASSAASGGDAGMLFALFSSDRSMRMKQVMARQLIDVELVTAGMDDANGDNTLIKGRNAKAFAVLRDELEAGKEKLAVFYGAGHLSDMADRLEDDFDMVARRTTWLDAWDLTRN